MDVSVKFQIHNNKWTVNAVSKQFDTEVGYITGEYTHIDSVYILEEYRGQGLCRKLLSTVFTCLDALYSGSGGLDDEAPVYSIDLQGSDRMCYCLLSTAEEHKRDVYYNSTHGITGYKISIKDCGETFKRGKYYIVSR